MGVNEKYRLSLDKEQRFLRLVNDRRRQIWGLINKYSFIRPHEREDIYQDILMRAWRYFDRWKGEGEIGAWYYVVAKHAIYYNYRSYRKHCATTRYLDDFTRILDPADIDRFSEREKDLHTVVKKLPHRQYQVASMLLQGFELPEIAERLRFSHRYATAISQEVKKSVRQMAADYFDNPALNLQEIEDRKDSYRRDQTKNRGLFSKPVHMLTLEGKFLKRYESVSSAQVDGFNMKLISGVATGKQKSAYGYRWVFEGETRQELYTGKIYKNGEACLRPVNQYDLVGNFIKTFPSLKSTKEEGFSPECVSCVVRGKTKQHKGFIWKYSD